MEKGKSDLDYVELTLEAFALSRNMVCLAISRLHAPIDLHIFVNLNTFYVDIFIE